MGRDLAQTVGGVADWHRNQHQVGALNSCACTCSGLVDDATLQGFLACVFRWAEAHHAFNQGFVLQGEGKGCAHEAAADQPELLELHAPTG
jgi:hypothetical protein